MCSGTTNTPITGELAIRGTYCDLAIKIDDKIVLLVEVKAVGLSLEDRHVKQAVDYAANEGIEWVVLTNGAIWRLYHVLFNKPIDKQLVAEFDLTDLDCKDENAVELLYVLTREGQVKGAHVELRDRQDATSRFLLAALLLENKSVLGMIRRELRRVVGINVDEEDIAKVMRNEVIKREAIEGPSADSASSKVRRSVSKVIVKLPPRGAAMVNMDLPVPARAEVDATTEAT